MPWLTMAASSSAAANPPATKAQHARAAIAAARNCAATMARDATMRVRVRATMSGRANLVDRTLVRRPPA